MVTNGGEGQHRGGEAQTTDCKGGSRMYSTTWGIKKRDNSVKIETDAHNTQSSGFQQYQGNSVGNNLSPGITGNPLQYPCLENPIDRAAWWAAVHRVAKSRTQLK